MKSESQRWIAVQDEQEIVERVRSAKGSGRRLAIRGGGTKAPTLWRSDSLEPQGIDMRPLAGIVSYQPEEFTITAKAGTPISTLQTALSACGQYLPFDPLLASRGSTVGGTLAAAADGPGRVRYGGVRDFILAVRFVDGVPTVARAGEKVVKNAAGFDLPKFFCGSLGRFAVLTEATFKVFPRPPAFRTVVIRGETGVLDRVYSSLCVSSLSLFGLEYARAGAGDGEGEVYVRVGGPQESLQHSVTAIEAVLESVAAGGEVDDQTVAEAEPERRLWQRLAELEWVTEPAAEQVVIKVGITPDRLSDIHPWLDPLEEISVLIGAAGQRMFVACSQSRLVEVDRALKALGVRGLVLCRLPGSADQPPVESPPIELPSIEFEAPGAELENLPFLGKAMNGVFLERVRAALDPNRVF